MKIKPIFSLILFLAIFVLYDTPASATIITVSPGGSIQTAVNQANPGDIITVQAGTYDERVNITKSNLTLQAQGPAITQGFSINNANYITIKDFEVANAIGKGIEVLGKNCVIENNYIHFASDGGILLQVTNTDPAATSNCVVKNNRLYQNAQFGIDVRGRNHTVENNEVWATIQHHPNRVPSPSWADADAFHFHGSGHIFRNNYIHDIKFNDTTVRDAHIDCFQTFEVLPYQEKATNVTFEGNRCIQPYYCHSDACKANPGQAVTKGFMLQKASNLTIRNNLIYAYNGIKSDRPASDPHFTILNNTFIGLTDQNELHCSVGSNCWPTGISLDSATNSVIKNNILYNQLFKAIELKNLTTGMQIDYNLAYRTDGTTPPGRPPAPFGQHDLWGINPLFINANTGDYHLRSGSPAIDAGVNGDDLGAYPYSGILTSPSPSPAPTKPGDFNHDGSVNLLDYNLLRSGFGTTYNLLHYNQLVQWFGQ